MAAGIDISVATAAEEAAVLDIARSLVEEGTTYAFGPETTDRELREYWLGPGRVTFVAKRQGRVRGCYVLRPNQIGRGRHVANASYAVMPGERGRGIGQAMGEHSLEEARRRGYKAMQFNFVVSTNEEAIRLWERLGFQIVGRVPRAFEHPEGSLVDALIMHRFL